MHERNLQKRLKISPSNKNQDYLSPFGQAKITSVFPGATKAKTEEISDQKTETTAVDDMERVIGEEDIESKKRRHESGDSIENEFCEGGDSSSNEKKKKDVDEKKKDVDDIKKDVDEKKKDVDEKKKDADGKKMMIVVMLLIYQILEEVKGRKLQPYAEKNRKAGGSCYYSASNGPMGCV